MSGHVAAGDVCTSCSCGECQYRRALCCGELRPACETGSRDDDVFCREGKGCREAMSPAQELRHMAAAYRKQGLKALAFGRDLGYDASAEALECADVSRVLETAATAVDGMDAERADEYLHQMKAALALREGASRTDEHEMELEP